MSIILKSGSSGDLADVTPQHAIKVDGSAVTQPVSIPSAIDVSDRSSRLAGHVNVDNFPATQPTTQVGGASLLVGDVQAKGVQGVNALMTQDFNDSGRVMKVFSATFTPTVVEAMVTLTPITDGVAGTPATTFAVTAGKKFRIQSISASLFNTTAAIRSLIVNLRMTSSGTVIVTSPQITTLGLPSTTAAIASLTQGNVLNFPDGMEFGGTMQFGISQQGIALAGSDIVIVGYEY